MKAYILLREDIDGEGGLYTTVVRAYLSKDQATEECPPSNEVCSHEVVETELIVPITQPIHSDAC